MFKLKNRGWILILVMVPFMMSCASYFKRKTCEKTNWFAHGEKVALSGKRIDADPFVSECKQVEAQINEMDLDLGFKKGMATYCTDQGAYETGRKGLKLSLDLCEDNRWPRLKSHHQKGVVEFCQPSNGYAQGAKGWEYNHICPKELEKGFLVKYHGGLRVYYNGEISDRRERLSEMDRKIMALQLEKSDLRNQLTRLESSINFRRHSRSVGQNQISPETPEETQMKSDLESRISDKDYQISRLHREKESASREITELRRKLRAVPQS
ncbi:MAG: DUF2799 domain-containing protein [Bdellovibrionales bacterium]|nr:DUF2799 domain-containing protein [Bdellovibrionales bacterium]